MLSHGDIDARNKHRTVSLGVWAEEAWETMVKNPGRFTTCSDNLFRDHTQIFDTALDGVGT